MQKLAASTENTEIPGKPTLSRDWSVSAIAAGFLAVLMGAGNAAGGYVVTERMLDMFRSSRKPGPKA